MKNRRSFLCAGAAFLASTLAVPVAFAQTDGADLPTHPQTQHRTPLPPDSQQFQESTYLAYVPSGDLAVDDIVRRGLEALAKRLNEKTGIEPKGVIAIDPARDDLTHFRYIYWAITTNIRPLNREAQAKIEKYIDKGGLIVFDQRGESDATKNFFAGISTRALTKMSNNHTLTRSFYKLQGLPGSKTLGDIFVEASSTHDNGAASSVIIATHNWADAWAGRTLHPQSRSYEMAMRAGINQVVYAFTGRYKDNSIIADKAIQNLGK